MKLRITTIIFLSILLTACSQRESEPKTLIIMVHDSFAVSEEIILAFQEENNIELRFLEAGDTGTAVNKAILSKNAPLADVFYGLDNTFLSRALEEKIFEPYESPFLKDIPEIFKLDPQYFVSPVDYGDVCLNIDNEYFSNHGLIPPNNFDDLLKSEYKGLLVVENPATSSPGLGFLFATIGVYGDPGYLEFWSGLVRNEVKVVNDWETAYYSEFSRWGGTHPIVVSYGSSPPFEVIFAEEPMEKPPTSALTSDKSCYRQIEFVGILEGTKNRKMAEQFVDFMLSPRFQEDIPLQMFVFPVNRNAKLDETFVKYLAVPNETAFIEPADIAANREKWIESWTETVLRSD